MHQNRPEGQQEGFRPTAWEWGEVLAGVVLAFIVWAVTKEVLSFTIAAVGIYAALLSELLRRGERKSTAEVKGLQEQTSRQGVEITQLLRGREIGYVRSLAKYQEGRYEVLEKEAVDIMRDYAERFNERMIATSYYDITNWTSVAREDTFWSVYDKRARTSLQRIKQRLASHFHDEEELNRFLEGNPIITRIFIVEKATWDGCKAIINAHLGTPGYQVHCTLKEVATTIGLADESRYGRVENLHDCVMFDSRIVVEIVQVSSDWAGSPINTYGIVFVPALERRDFWMDQFKGYFDRLLQESCSYAEMNTYFEGRERE